MNRLAAVSLSILFALAALAAPASAQFDSAITDSVQRRQVHIGPTQVTPESIYTAIQNDWPFTTGQVVATVYTPRPAKLVGAVRIDHAYFVQNRYHEFVESYVEYTANIVRSVPHDPSQFGNGAQVCTQFCGQMVHPGIGTYALAPFSGTYQEPPTAPFPINCQGVEPTSDFHFFRAPNIVVPIELWLAPGDNDIVVHSMGGMGSWNGVPLSGESHLAAYFECMNELEFSFQLLWR